MDNAASGVAQFLKHFSPRREAQQQKHQPLSPGRRFRSLKKGISRNTNKNNKHQSAADFASPTSVTAGPWKQQPDSTTTAGSEEEAFSFEGDGTRLGISPTRYDIPENFIGVPLPSSLVVPDQEGVIFNDAKQQAPQQLPNIFTSLAVWEESTKIELGDTEPSSSPEKSIASSCDSASDLSSSGSMLSSASRLFRSSKSAASTETKRKAKEIVGRARGKENASGGRWRSISPSAKSQGSTASGSGDAPSSSTVKIFLLLLEPNTKVFELIQLVYPRKNTKVGDLLKLIPKDATEPSLASQSYVGITRAKRRAEPFLDLKLLASNSVHTSQATAGITQGEIILAIPAHARASQIVSLSKQILASTHIQKLIAKSSSNNNNNAAIGKHRRNNKVRRDSSSQGNGSVGSSSKGSSHARATPVGQAAAPVDSATKRMQDRVDKNVVFCKAPSNSESFHQYCENEMKRAVEKTNTASKQAGRGPSLTPTRPFRPENQVAVGSAKKEHKVEFPRDMLDAYLSKDAVQKMCGGKLTVEDRSLTTLTDDMSCDGSLTSSFHSWSQSIDDSVATLTKANLLEQSCSSMRLRKRRLAKHMTTLKRFAAATFVVTVTRYNLDPNGLAGMAGREGIRWQPMGWTGLLLFLLSFFALAKIQRCFLREHIVPISQSRCPAMLLVSQIYESRNRPAISTVNLASSSRSNNNAIKFA